MAKRTDCLPFEDTPRGQIDEVERFEAMIDLAVSHVVSLAHEFNGAGAKHLRIAFVGRVGARLMSYGDFIPTPRALEGAA